MPRRHCRPTRSHVNSRHRLLQSFLLLSVFATTTVYSNDSEKKKPEDNYASLCANCHGGNLEGALGPSLRNHTLGRLAGPDYVVEEFILLGSENGSMPGFKSAITKEDAQAMVSYIRGKAKERTTPHRSKAIPEESIISQRHNFRVEKLVDNLDVPWSIDFLPNGSMLFTERRGQIFVLETPYSAPKQIEDAPGALVRDEGGLMAIRVHPDYRENGWIYLSLSDPKPDGTANTAILRGRIKDGSWTDQETIFKSPDREYSYDYRGFGSRIAFHEEYLYFTVGDRWNANSAQDLSYTTGKVHRTYADGSIPANNPFIDDKNAIASIWTFGHRNLQGLAIDHASGEIWTTEHGPRGGDELNYIVKGDNYGWPIVTHGTKYDGSQISPHTEMEGMRSPVKHWTPSIANSPIHFYQGDAFPEWKGDLFLGSLAQQLFIRFKVDGDKIIEEENIFQDLGRIREITTGPDGYLYLALELPGEPGYIVRLVPSL